MGESERKREREREVVLENSRPGAGEKGKGAPCCI